MAVIPGTVRKGDVVWLQDQDCLGTLIKRTSAKGQQEWLATVLRNWAEAEPAEFRAFFTAWLDVAKKMHETMGWAADQHERRAAFGGQMPLRSSER